MMTPSKLILREWKKPEAVLELHGWRPDRGVAFVRNSERQQLLMRFVTPPLPLRSEFEVRPIDVKSLLSRGASPPLVPQPLPESLPTRIDEVRLVPPPCCSDELEAERLRKAAEAEPMIAWLPLNYRAWESARLRYDPEVLIPKAEHAPRLNDALERFLAAKRVEYAARRQELETIQRLYDHQKALIGGWHYYGYLCDSRETAAFWLGQEKIKLELEFTRGCLQWTGDRAQ